MDRSIKAGVLGFILAVIVNLFSPVSLYFVPSFVAAILVIFVFGLETFREGLVAAFMTYIFNDGILTTLGLAILYYTSEPYPAFNVDLWTVLFPAVSAVTALIAGYVGVWLAKMKKPAQRSLPLVQPPLQPA